MWEKIEKEHVSYYTLPDWQKAGARIIMTTREGGFGKPPYATLNLALHVGDDPDTVVDNRRLLLKETSLDEKDFVSVQQIHGKEIFYADETAKGRGFWTYASAIEASDGIFTDRENLLMATFYADCLPLAVFHPEQKLLGLAHAGWKGTYQNIGLALIEAMRGFRDFDPTELWAATGAGIGPCCYEVDASFYERFMGKYPAAEAWFSATDSGKYHFDNEKANKALLMKAGVKEENISVLGLCTSCHDDLFFSYRKEAGRTGRHGLWGALI